MAIHVQMRQVVEAQEIAALKFWFILFILVECVFISFQLFFFLKNAPAQSYAVEMEAPQAPVIQTSEMRLAKEQNSIFCEYLIGYIASEIFI